MKKDLYRKEIVEKQGVDKLDDYTRINKPSLIVLLLFICALLLAFFFWSVFGKIESKIDSYVYANNGDYIGYFSPSDTEKIKDDLKVYVGDKEGKVSEISSNTIETNSLSNSELYYFNLEKDTICYKVTYSFPELEDGFYSAKIVIEELTPFSFIFNG